jgi:hypothetical protein
VTSHASVNQTPPHTSGIPNLFLTWRSHCPVDLVRCDLPYVICHISHPEVVAEVRCSLVSIDCATLLVQSSNSDSGWAAGWALVVERLTFIAWWECAAQGKLGLQQQQQQQQQQ